MTCERRNEIMGMMIEIQKKSTESEEQNKLLAIWDSALGTFFVEPQNALGCSLDKLGVYRNDPEILALEAKLENENQ